MLEKNFGHANIHEEQLKESVSLYVAELGGVFTCSTAVPPAKKRPKGAVWMHGRLDYDRGTKFLELIRPLMFNEDELPKLKREVWRCPCPKQ